MDGWMDVCVCYQVILSGAEEGAVSVAELERRFELEYHCRYAHTPRSRKSPAI